jgi:hypothetical protein
MGGYSAVTLKIRKKTGGPSAQPATRLIKAGASGERTVSMMVAILLSLGATTYYGH